MALLNIFYVMFCYTMLYYTLLMSACLYAPFLCHLHIRQHVSFFVLCLSSWSSTTMKAFRYTIPSITIRNDLNRSVRSNVYVLLSFFP
ncbi:hypothetical protein BDV06DRAFT_71013 [Aspergillus oleicola]